MKNRNGIISILMLVFLLTNYQCFCQKSRITRDDSLALKKAAADFKTPRIIHKKRIIRVPDTTLIRNTDNDGNKTYVVGRYNLSEPDSDIFLRIIGYISSKEGKLIEVNKRIMIHKSNGNKYYFLEYILEGNTASSVIFQYAGIDLEKPVDRDKPSIKKCVIDDKFCTDCMWQRDADDSGNPLWSCDCLKSNDLKNSGDCALLFEIISDFSSYFIIGKSIINKLKISELQLEQFKTY